MSEKEIVFCKSGGCTAKLGAGVLEHILERLPKGKKDEKFWGIQSLRMLAIFSPFGSRRQSSLRMTFSRTTAAA